jgi:hypothetical protein
MCFLGGRGSASGVLVGRINREEKGGRAHSPQLALLLVDPLGFTSGEVTAEFPGAAGW